SLRDTAACCRACAHGSISGRIPVLAERRLRSLPVPAPAASTPARRCRRTTTPALQRSAEDPSIRARHSPNAPSRAWNRSTCRQDQKSINSFVPDLFTAKIIGLSCRVLGPGRLHFVLRRVERILDFVGRERGK